MNKQNILFGIIGLLAGFIIGFFFANNINRNALLTGSPNSQSPPGNPQMQSANIKEPQGSLSGGGTGGGMMPEVAQTMEKAQNEPDNFEAQIRAGEMYMRIQNPEKANEFFQRAAKVQRNTFEDLTTIGNAFFDIRNFEEAEKWYMQALAKNPNDVNVRTDLGSTFMERSQPDIERAIKEYRTSLEKDPKHENTLYNLSLALMRKGDREGAQETLDQLEKINPISPLVSRLKEKIAGTK
jgi:tetratricopeptide (TPR) repeat protein